VGVSMLSVDAAVSADGAVLINIPSHLGVPARMHTLHSDSD